MKILLVSLVVFSFLLAGCGGQKDTTPSAPTEPSAAAPTQPQTQEPTAPTSPVAEEEVAVAPEEQGKPPVVETIPGEEVPEVEAPPLEPEPEEVAAPAADDELAHLFDIELTEPLEEFEYGNAPGE